MARGIFALVIVVALVVAVVALGGGTSTKGATKQGEEKTTPGTTTPPAKNPEILTPVKRVLECEKPAKLEDKAPDGTIVMRFGTAQMGKPMGYLEIPDGWMKTCGLDSADKKENGGLLPGKAIYEFEVPREDDYYLFIRAKWMDSCGNSVWVRVDEKPYIGVEDTIGEMGSTDSYKWAWHPVQEMAKNKPFKLGPGKHTLELNTKEDGPMFDKVLISTDAGVPGENEVDP